MIAYSSLKKNVLKPLLRMILPVISVMYISFIIIPPGSVGSENQSYEIIVISISSAT